MKNIYLLADTHFNHQALTDVYNDRPEGFTDLIIDNWAEALSGGGTTIHMGDVIFSCAGDLKHLLEKVQGTKILVKGNHDKRKDNWYLSHGFDFICDSFSLNTKKGNILFTHEPQLELPDKYDYNVHGHTHGNSHRLQSWMMYPKYLELALERTDYKPVALDDFLGLGLDNS